MNKGFSLIRFLKALFIGFLILGVLLFIAYRAYMKWEYAALEASASAYVEASSNALITYMMSDTKAQFKGTCQVAKDKLTCPNINAEPDTVLQVYLHGNLPSSGTITFSETGAVIEANLDIRKDETSNLFKNHKVVCKETNCHIKS